MCARRQLFRFSLKGLLMFMLLVAAACGLLKWKLVRKQRERAAVASIRVVGGNVYYRWPPPRSMHPQTPQRVPVLGRLLGDDFFSDVVGVSLHGGEITAEWLVHIEPLGELRAIDLIWTQIGDDGVRYLARFKSVTHLALLDDSITTAGLTSLAELPSLRSLNFSGDRFGDAEMVVVGNLGELERLILYNTVVTDNGLKDLDLLRHLKELVLNDTAVTDAGLVHLQYLPKLKRLTLDRTVVSDAGLTHLKRLKGLSELSVAGSAISREGLIELHRTLPNCKISPSVAEQRQKRARDR